MNLTKCKNSTLKNYVNKNNPSSLEVKHVLDYLKKHPKEKLARASYPQVLKKAQIWIERINKKNQNLKDSGRIKIIKRFTNGFRFVKLLSQKAKDWEGKNMGNCVASYEDENIYSLRDEEHQPHCTFHIEGKEVLEFSGRQNNPVTEKYLQMVLDCLSSYKVDSDLLADNELKPVSAKEVKFIKKYMVSYRIYKFKRKQYIQGNSFDGDFFYDNGFHFLNKSALKSLTKNFKNYKLAYMGKDVYLYDFKNIEQIRPVTTKGVDLFNVFYFSYELSSSKPSFLSAYAAQLLKNGAESWELKDTLLITLGSEQYFKFICENDIQDDKFLATKGYLGVSNDFKIQFTKYFQQVQFLKIKEQLYIDQNQQFYLKENINKIDNNIIWFFLNNQNPIHIPVVTKLIEIKKELVVNNRHSYSENLRFYLKDKYQEVNGETFKFLSTHVRSLNWVQVENKKYIQVPEQEVEFLPLTEGPGYALHEVFKFKKLNKFADKLLEQKLLKQDDVKSYIKSLCETGNVDNLKTLISYIEDDPAFNTQCALNIRSYSQEHHRTSFKGIINSFLECGKTFLDGDSELDDDNWSHLGYVKISYHLEDLLKYSSLSGARIIRWGFGLYFDLTSSLTLNPCRKFTTQDLPLFYFLLKHNLCFPAISNLCELNPPIQEKDFFDFVENSIIAGEELLFNYLMNEGKAKGFIHYQEKKIQSLFLGACASKKSNINMVNELYPYIKQEIWLIDRAIRGAFSKGPDWFNDLRDIFIADYDILSYGGYVLARTNQAIFHGQLIKRKIK